MLSRYAALPDEMLMLVIEKLARLVASLGDTATPCGRKVRDAYETALQDARREQERRRC